MRTRLKLALSNLNPVTALVLLWRVIQQLTGNINFATPAVPLADMTTLANQLQDAISVAKEGSKQDKAFRDALTQQAKGMLITQAAYVTLEGGGDYQKLLSSGFDLAKTPVPIVVPGIPQALVASTGNAKGEVNIRFKHSPGAHTYAMFKAEQDPSQGTVEWVLVANTTRARNTISGLESFKPYWFRVQAIGVSGTSLMSNASLAAAA